MVLCYLMLLLFLAKRMNLLILVVIPLNVFFCITLSSIACREFAQEVF